MKAREMRKETTKSIFTSDIINKTFLFDDNVNAKKVRVQNGREDNIRYLLKILFNGHGRTLYLTERALEDLLISTSQYSGVVVTVRFDGKQGYGKATKWLFSVVTDSKAPEKKDNISRFM